KLQRVVPPTEISVTAADANAHAVLAPAPETPTPPDAKLTWAAVAQSAADSVCMCSATEMLAKLAAENAALKRQIAQRRNGIAQPQRIPARAASAAEGGSSPSRVRNAQTHPEQ